MTAGAFPFFVLLAEAGKVADGAPAPGIFCLLDRRPEDPDCVLAADAAADEGLLLSALRLRDVGVVEDGGFGGSAEAEAVDDAAAEAGEPDG